jgi:hypothetical protein
VQCPFGALHPAKVQGEHRTISRWKNIMNEHFSSHDCQLSLVELLDITAGKGGEVFAGEYTNSGKQVGSMTIDELGEFYNTQKLSFCISYGRDGYTVTLRRNDLFSSESTSFIPR